MRCQLTGFIYQAALMDFSKVFTALHFQSFTVNLSKVMLLYRFQLKTLLWGGIVAYWSVFQDEFQNMRGLIHLKEMWKLPTAHLPLILSHRGCLTFRPQLKHPLQECPSKDDLAIFNLIFFFIRRCTYWSFLPSVCAVCRSDKTVGSRIGNYLINEFLTDPSIQGMCHKSFAFG